MFGKTFRKCSISNLYKLQGSAAPGQADALLFNSLSLQVDFPSHLSVVLGIGVCVRCFPDVS